MTHVRKVMLKPQYNAEPVECIVEVEIDLDSIVQYLGTKALRNKTGRTGIGGRLIRVIARPCQGDV